MRLTFGHLSQAKKNRKVQNIQNKHYFDENEGITTLKYPYEAIPAPVNGRYQLYNEIEDCIVCDKCAKVCPVDCIDIEPIKSAEEFGKTSDGTSKRIYAAKFDIDMAKCCFCGLCTTVCPTECLTMTDEYDFSVFELGKLNFGFGNLTEEEAEQKRLEWEKAQENKKKPVAETKEETPSTPVQNPPAFRPRMPGAGPKPIPVPEKKSSEPEDEKPVETKPAFQPRMRPNALKNQAETPKNEEISPEEKPNAENQSEEKPEIKPAFQPRMRPVIKPTEASSKEEKNPGPQEPSPENQSKPEEKPAFQPRMRPVIKPKPPEENA